MLYLKDADSESRHGFLKFWPQNSIFRKISAKKVKIVRFVWKLVHMVSRGCWFLFQHLFFEFLTLNSFLDKFGPKMTKLLVLSKSWHIWYLEDADSYFNICFLNFDLKLHFWPHLGQKSQICPSCLEIGTLSILRMRIFVPRLVFWIIKPKSI